ncbi:MAG: segregation/condensation protein A [Eubacteriales bacterium]|nr:segregation/condensation protein A [Eubacteriales bacterium]MDD3883041.1 segregation/condensation protein A [Eubacteriales bacterium]MDD4513632.1 segregation/condensation protein A [Eubacteriales bacterium]
MPYHVKLKQFDGPLDFLLHLISKAKIDIKDIFISEITDQYLASMDNIGELDMDSASEFLTMAATLLEIKSRALLPKPPKDEGEDDDPEQALIRRLEEYKRFKETAGNMAEFEKAAKAMYEKLPEEYPLPPQEFELVGLTLEGLIQAFLRATNRRPPEEVPVLAAMTRELRRDSFTVQECMLHILRRLQRSDIPFSSLLSSEPSREEVVTMFLALLELLRLGKAHVRQDDKFDDFKLYRGRPAEENAS